MGHCINDDLTDDDDVYRKCGMIYAQAIMLVCKFSVWSDAGIKTLFKVCGTQLYMAHLWSNYEESTLLLWLSFVLIRGVITKRISVWKVFNFLFQCKMFLKVKCVKWFDSLEPGSSCKYCSYGSTHAIQKKYVINNFQHSIEQSAVFFYTLLLSEFDLNSVY